MIDLDGGASRGTSGDTRLRRRGVRTLCPGRPVWVIARRPDTIVGVGETRVHAETAAFEVRTSEVASPRPADHLTIGGESFVVQGEPGRCDPDRLVCSLDVRPL